MKKILLITLLLSNFLYAEIYQVNNTKSYIGFGVKNMLLPYTVGQFTKYSGSFTYDEEHNYFLSLDGAVKVASVSTESEDRDEHLRSDDFFGVVQYPDMTLRLIRQHKENSLMVNLTIRGITKPVIFTIHEMFHGEADSKGTIARNFILKASINRQDFNVTHNNFFGIGEKMIEDIVDIKLIIVGVHKTSFD